MNEKNKQSPSSDSSVTWILWMTADPGVIYGPITLQLNAHLHLMAIIFDAIREADTSAVSGFHHLDRVS